MILFFIFFLIALERKKKQANALSPHLPSHRSPWPRPFHRAACRSASELLACGDPGPGLPRRDRQSSDADEASTCNRRRRPRQQRRSSSSSSSGRRLLQLDPVFFLLLLLLLLRARRRPARLRRRRLGRSGILDVPRRKGRRGRPLRRAGSRGGGREGRRRGGSRELPIVLLFLLSLPSPPLLFLAARLPLFARRL